MNNQLSASIVSVIMCLVLVSPVHAERSCAMKSNEQGGLDTGIPASTLWPDGFTLSAWVMPEYVYADRGPIFGLTSANFWFGAGPFRARQRNAEDCAPYVPVMRVRLGSESIDYLAPDFERDRWNHVALTWTPTPHGALVQLFVDGTEILPYVGFDASLPPPMECLGMVDLSDPAKEFTSPEATTAPNGTLFVGGAGNRYFYGLVDDATIQNRPLSPEEIADLASGGAADGRSVIWSDTFDAEVCNGQIGGGRAVRVPVDQTPADAALFDDPALVAPTIGTYHLPFAPGEIWKVIQGFDSIGSHNDASAFCWDFILSTGQPSTALQVVRAAAPGTMVHVVEDENPPDGTLESNHVYIQTAPGEMTSHRHLEHDSVTKVFFGNDPPLFLPQEGNFTVPVGGEDLLAQVADNDRPHLHFGLKPGWNSKYTVPMAFSDYQLLVYCFTTVPVKGSIPIPSVCTEWMNVDRGIPEDDTFIRREP
jgi:Concanavalin A-like lectin/glucanases superfamily